MDDSKRKFLIKASTAVGAIQVFPSCLLASSNDNCSVIDRLIQNASDQALLSSAWSSTEGFTSVASMRESIDKLNTDIASVSRDMDRLQTDRVLTGLSIFGSSVFVGLGVLAATSTIAVSAGPVIIGTIVFSAGMILAKLFTIPHDIKLVEILNNRANVSIGTILSSMGDDVYVLSSSTAKFSRIAGPLVGSAFLAYEISDLIQKNRDYSKLTEKVEKLQLSLMYNSQILKNITAPQMSELRKACSDAVAEDLEREKSLSCLPTDFTL